MNNDSEKQNNMPGYRCPHCRDYFPDNSGLQEHFGSHPECRQVADLLLNEIRYGIAPKPIL